MFKAASFQNDILKKMGENLSQSSEQTQEMERFNKIANCLTSAAEIFKKAGMQKESQEVIEIIKDLSESLSK